MSQTRKKRRTQSTLEKREQIAQALQVAEVLEALAGEALAEQREREAAAIAKVEQEALIASTQESERRAASGFVLKRTVESLLFAADRPLQASVIRQYLGSSIDRKELQECLDGLVEEYSSRGMVLHDVAGGYQFRTHPASSTWIQKLIAGRPVRLSRAQLDTLAIIAYRQPITRPEIDDIRGVDSGSTLKILLDRNLLRILGKKEEVGRPLLYGTSKDFLEFFNLSELRDLPTLREFHELNDDGMAQVDKLGADIKGVDVGAVAREAAEEREAARVAGEALEAALAEEKRQARATARAERDGEQAPEPEGEHAEAPGEQVEARGESDAAAGQGDTDMGLSEVTIMEEPALVMQDEATTPDEATFANDEAQDARASAGYDTPPKESEMAGRENDTESDADDSIGQDENTRLDLTPAPDRDPDTILEEDVDATRTDIAAASPDMTVVDRVAAPETSTEINAIGENTVLDSSSIEHTIPEGTLADILPPGLGGASGGSESSIDDLTLVPSDTTE